MKKLPFVKKSYSRLHDITMAPIHSRLLMAGVELGLFDGMEDFRSAKEIADDIGTHPGNTERLLDALTTIGLVEKREGRFKNTPEVQLFLVKQEPAYLGNLFAMIQRMCVTPLDNIVELVRIGPLPDDENNDFASDKRWAEATRASAAWVTGGTGPQMAIIISDLPEFPRFRRMLDLGGGHGMFAIYFVDAHPSMTGVVFDRHAVVSVAEEFIREYGMQDRVAVVSGDYLTDDIGSGFDLIWACATLNFARDDLDALFTKVKAALNPGGVFISLQEGMTHEKTQPDTMLGHLGDALRSISDFSFEQGEIADTMLRCGFRSVRSKTVYTSMGVMDMDIARG